MVWDRKGRVSVCLTPDLADLFSEGGEVIQLRIEGSLTRYQTGITTGMLKLAQALEPDRAAAQCACAGLTASYACKDIHG